VGQIYFGDQARKWVRIKSALTTNELGNSVQIIPMRKSHPECLDLLEEHEGELSSSEFATPLVGPGNSANSLSLDRRDQVPQRSPLARGEFSLLERAVVGASRVPGTRPAAALRRPADGPSGMGTDQGCAGSIQGVYSLADGRPIRRQGFESSLANFEEAENYQQWIFGLQPAVSRGPPPSRPMGL
jgi:hypothetical protein